MVKHFIYRAFIGGGQILHLTVPAIGRTYGVGWSAEDKLASLSSAGVSVRNLPQLTTVRQVPSSVLCLA